MDRYKNTRFISRLIVSYSALLLVILAMGVYLYNISIKNVRHEIRNQNKIILQKAISNLDEGFTAMDALSGQVAKNSDIVRLAKKEDNTDSNFYTLALKIKSDLADYISIETLLPIDSYYIYMEQSGYLLSYSFFESNELFYSGKIYRKGKFEDWLDMINDTGNNRNLVSLAEYKESGAVSYLYKLPLTQYSLRAIPALICFEIDSDKVQKIFSELNYFSTGYLAVTDSQGNLVFSIDGEESGDVPLEELKNLVFQNGFSQYGTLDEEMYVTTSQSDYNNWTYYLVQPTQASLYSLEQYRDIFIVIICLALIFGFILIFILSKRNVRPIIQLGNELRETITSKNSLQNIVDTQTPILQESYLSRLMRGEILTEQELDYAQQFLMIDTKQKIFSVLYLVAYMNQYDSEEEERPLMTEEETESCDETIKTAIAQHFGDFVHIYKASEREYALLMTADEEEAVNDLREQLKESFEHMHQSLMGTYAIWLFAGMGTWNNDLMTTWKSFQQANEAVIYATKKHKFRTYNEIKRDSSSYYYPLELATRLTNFITNGNEGQVLEIFETLRFENMEERSLTIKLMKWLLSDIRNTLLKVRFLVKEEEQNAEMLKTIDVAFGCYNSLKLCEDIARNLCRFFDSKSSASQLIANCKEYIKRNYKDPSLCLNKISDKFAISESYFSFLFKEEAGENFSVYLESIRMERAVQLIRETNINMGDIYKDIGYNNSNTFRRAFKKRFGISPKAMRDAKYLKEEQKSNEQVII